MKTARAGESTSEDCSEFHIAVACFDRLFLGIVGADFFSGKEVMFSIL